MKCRPAFCIMRIGIGMGRDWGGVKRRNEEFKSRSRCCADCCRRQVKVTDPAGQGIEVTEYY